MIAISILYGETDAHRGEATFPKITQPGSCRARIWKQGSLLLLSPLQVPENPGDVALELLTESERCFNCLLYSLAPCAWCHQKLMVLLPWPLSGTCGECLQQVLLGGSVRVPRVSEAPKFFASFLPLISINRLTFLFGKIKTHKITLS